MTGHSTHKDYGKPIIILWEWVFIVVKAFLATGRPDMALLWNRAAGSINLEFISYWNSGVLADPDNHLTHEERSVLQKKVNKTMGRFGDRRCHLTIIGRSDEVHDFTSALINCFFLKKKLSGGNQVAFSRIRPLIYPS